MPKHCITGTEVPTVIAPVLTGAAFFWAGGGGGGEEEKIPSLITYTLQLPNYIRECNDQGQPCVHVYTQPWTVEPR